MQANDANSIFKDLQGGENSVTDESVKKAVSSLNASQKNRLNDILSSPDKIRELLGTEKAQEILKKLGR